MKPELVKLILMTKTIEKNQPIIIRTLSGLQHPAITRYRTTTIKPMTLSEQYELISTKGKYIGVRLYYNHAISLYLLDDIFYEVWYFKPYNQIVRIDVLEDEKTLDLYILSMNALDKKEP